MNTSTQAMNHVNKVQTPSVGNKPKQGQQEPDLNFTELFSSALGQSAPKAQLNSIETQLRESLCQQNKPKKNNESTVNAEAAQAAQAAVWAQRNWMQTTPVQQATTVATAAAAKNTEVAKQAVTPENRAESNTPDNTAPTDSTNASTSSENSRASSRGAQQTPEQNADNNTEQAAKVGLPGTIANAANSEVALDTTTPTAELALNRATDGEPVAQLINPTKPEQATGNELAGADKTRPDLKTTTQLKADATVANSAVQVRAEAGPGNLGNTVQAQLNQQLNPQIAPQITQQAQAMGEGFGEEGLKVGQKILATGNLQSAGTTTGIAAGTNGLTGSAGTAQQALIKTPVNQPGFAKELGQTVQWAIGKNLSTVDIRVNPESFGPMNMRLVQKGQQVQLVIRTQDEASANLLTQALGGLKEVLAQNGLQLNQVQIQHGNPSNQQGQPNNSQTQFDQNRNQGQGHGQHAAGGDNSQPETAAPATTAVSRKPEGKLDLFA